MEAGWGGELQNLLDKVTEVYAEGEQLKFYPAVSCDKCNKTGSEGRMGFREFVIVDHAVKKLIQKHARVAKLFASAVNSAMRALKWMARKKC